MKHLVSPFISALLLSSCMSGTPKIKPADIYKYEATHYPGSSWLYVGSEGRWHYFENWSWVAHHDWKLDRKHLPELHGFPYHSKSSSLRKAVSTDVEIHAEFIRMQVEGHPPSTIPFKSQGFITAEHRTKGGSEIKVHSQGREVTQKATP